MPALDRITRDLQVMGGKPCLRGMRVTVGMTVGLVASGHTFEDVLSAYPYLEHEDIRQALAWAPWPEPNESPANAQPPYTEIDTRHVQGLRRTT